MPINRDDYFDRQNDADETLYPDKGGRYSTASENSDEVEAFLKSQQGKAGHTPNPAGRHGDMQEYHEQPDNAPEDTTDNPVGRGCPAQPDLKHYSQHQPGHDSQDTGPSDVQAISVPYIPHCPSQVDHSRVQRVYDSVVTYEDKSSPVGG